MQDEWQDVLAARQDPAAFRPLYDRYYEPIFGFVYRRTADYDICGDITAQIFLKALQKIHSFEYRGVPFQAWLYRIASNEIAQYYRDNKKNRVVAVEDTGLQMIAEELEDNTDTEALLLVMQEVIQQLPDEEVRLIEMRFFEKRPFADIAEILDISENNAKVRTYRLLDRIKKLMLKRYPSHGR